VRLVFRADASVAIGSGHVTRCLTLADEIKARGGDTAFVCRQETGHLGELVASRGHRVLRLAAGISATDDAAACVNLLTEGADWMVVDHYGLDAGWETSLRRVCRSIMVIDDLADRPHDCDLLLDQNLLSAERYGSLVAAGCRLLQGPRYALLRPIFRKLRADSKDRRQPPRRVLVFLGGADFGDFTMRALKALDDHPELAVDVVVDRNHPGAIAHADWCRRRGNARSSPPSDCFPEMLAAADIVVGAGGTTTWERCCLGLPSVVVGIAENQYRVAEAVGDSGAHLYLGAAEQVREENLRGALTCLLSSPSFRVAQAACSRALVDGLGCQRVADCLLPSQALAIRRAGISDSGAIFRWRNDPTIRHYAFDPTPLDRAGHDAWFARCLGDDSRVLLVGEDESGPVGVIRYDLAQGQALTSVYLVPERRGEGLGAPLLAAAARWLAGRHPEIRQVVAQIRPDNKASCRAFGDAGYIERHRQYVLDL
jgi:UDP-2,4-diacetamido-2,4,6-trideoxy-beta-L-altropyranose hydrolase